MGNLNDTIKNEFGNNVTIRNRRPVSGGDINRSYALELSDGSKVFMKANRRENADFFRAEAEGLAAIRETGTIRVPALIASGTDDDESFLLLEYIESGAGGRQSSEELGTGLAMMHMTDAARFVTEGHFGFTSDNYIGAGEQINTPKQTWVDFFIECRMIPQYERAYRYFDSGERRAIERFLYRLDRLLAEPERPSLIHGDLWAGNYMTDAEGHPWLIDPAVYVGHAEADLAMTELFGGFDRAFYDAYKNAAGIDPNYKDRRDIYNLYHLLNHLNLFGEGYLHSVQTVIRRYAG